MKQYKKIFLIWGIILGLALVGFAFFPHRAIQLIGTINDSFLILIGIVSLYIFKREPSLKNKPIFLNFAIFSLANVGSFLNAFIGKAFFTGERYAIFFAYQYFSVGLLYFLLTFSLIYVVFDTLFNDFQIYKKYLLTLLVVGGTFAYYYSPVFTDPKHAYHTPEIVDFKAVTTTIDQLKKEGNANPTSNEIAAIADLPAWNDGKVVGTLFQEQKIARVNELLPYMEGGNFLMLLYRPLYLDVVYMNVLCLVFIFLFFGYQYKNDPPQGAYIEKIVFLFLPYCSLEILHYYGYIKSVEYATYLDIHRIGQYLTLLNLALLLIFFSLRLRFITSVKGEFYERELVSDSEHISRWRDSFDNLIVRHFLDPQTLHGRLFTPRPPRG